MDIVSTSKLSNAMDRTLTLSTLKPRLRAMPSGRLAAHVKAAATALYFHSVPHPLSEVLYWNALYVRARWTSW